MTLNSRNIRKLLLVSIMVASKVFDDFYYSNKHWSVIGGISLKEINSLELDFLFLFTFDVGVTPEEYKSFLHSLLYSCEDDQKVRVMAGNKEVIAQQEEPPAVLDSKPTHGRLTVSGVRRLRVGLKRRSSCGVASTSLRPEGPSMEHSQPEAEPALVRSSSSPGVIRSPSSPFVVDARLRSSGKKVSESIRKGTGARVGQAETKEQNLSLPKIEQMFVRENPSQSLVLATLGRHRR